MEEIVRLQFELMCVPPSVVILRLLFLWRRSLWSLDALVGCLVGSRGFLLSLITYLAHVLLFHKVKEGLALLDAKDLSDFCI